MKIELELEDALNYLRQNHLNDVDAIIDVVKNCVSNYIPLEDVITGLIENIMVEGGESAKADLAIKLSNTLTKFI